MVHKTGRRFGVGRRISAIGLVALMSIGAMQPAVANSADFVRGLWPLAQAKGVSRQAFEASFAGYAMIPKVLELTRKQPEFTKTVGQYIATAVNDTRTSTGRAMRSEWAQTLAGAQQRWGVQPEIVLAIWGMETNFGGFMGGNNTILALAPLTEGGYRTACFRK